MCFGAEEPADLGEQHVGLERLVEEGVTSDDERPLYMGARVIRGHGDDGHSTSRRQALQDPNELPSVTVRKDAVHHDHRRPELTNGPDAFCRRVGALNIQLVGAEQLGELVATVVRLRDKKDHATVIVRHRGARSLLIWFRRRELFER
jgi:hypothetical protein